MKPDGRMKSDLSVCACVCGGQEKGRKTQERGRRGSTGLGSGPSQSRARWTETAVNRRHARPSVKLETSRARPTAKSLIVGTPVRSHRRGVGRVAEGAELQAETHFTGPS